MFVILFYKKNFSFSKRGFFFLWFLTCENDIFEPFFCSYIVKTFSVVEFQSVLFYFFCGNIVMYFIFKAKAVLLKRNFLIIKSVLLKLKVLNPINLILILKQPLYFIINNIKAALNTIFFFFKRNSKKEFNSEKINTFLLKKKKFELFLKKYYKS